MDRVTQCAGALWAALLAGATIDCSLDGLMVQVVTVGAYSDSSLEVGYRMSDFSGTHYTLVPLSTAFIVVFDDDSQV